MPDINTISKYHIATAVAILFHVIGLTGMLFSDKEFFISATPVHLLLMCLLLFYTQPRPNAGFIIFFLACFFIGFTAELIGTNTGLLFGRYAYGSALGYGIKDVPLMIGINWFIIIYCCGMSMNMLFDFLSKKTATGGINSPAWVKAFSVIIDGATLAAVSDFFLEPAAIRLDYWKWLDTGAVPWFNYVCWFLLSILLLTVFQFCPFPKQNKFAINLLLIQLMFFLVIRTFL